MLRPGDVVGGRFALQEEAGSGGMAVVFRALDLTTQQIVAVKVVLRGGGEMVDRFAREVQVLASLQHPGIVRHLAHGTTEAGPYLAMEWLAGEDLSHRLARAPLSLAQCVTVVARAAEALAFAHARGIVHRDIKPGNLFLLDGDGERVKVVDFGIAHLGRSTRSLTRTGAMIGTPLYMAPEQARGFKDLDARVDVFALGCVLFECATGRSAFAGAHEIAVLAKILLEEAPRLSDLLADVPPALDDLVARMLCKDPAGRPADGAALARELLDLALDTASNPAAPPVRNAVLTTGEQRFFSVLLAQKAAGAASATLSDLPAKTILDGGRITSPDLMHRTVPEAPGAGGPGSLAELVAAQGGRLDVLADGTAVITVAGMGVATDLAAQAARCALAVRAVLPLSPMALATGRGEVSARWPVGEVLDRAAALLMLPVPSDEKAVRIDDVTAGLLDARFELTGDPAGLALVGQHRHAASVRTLLGRPSPCVGRDRELAMLTGTLDECVGEEVARAVLVTAPPGAGKSRLRHEFLERVEARSDAIEVWIASCDPVGAGSPFGIVAQLIHQAAGLLGGEPLSVRRQKLRARAARYLGDHEVSRVAEFLGEVIDAQFPDERSPQLRAARLDAQVMSDQIARAWEDLLGAAAREQPIVLVVEDLHWGDLPSLRLIEGALRNLPDRALMVLWLARPAVYELFPGIGAGLPLVEVKLADLGRKAAERLVRHVLGDAVAASTVELLINRAAGNAFYLEELIRAAAEGRLDALPETVLAMAGARLDALEAEARQILRAASVLGDVFWLAAIEALLGQRTGSEAGEWLAALVDRELVARRPASRFVGEEEFAFRHGLVREAAHAMLTDGDRALGHKLAAEWLEAKGELDAVVLAEHYERGGDPARAAGFWARASEHALEGDDLEGAIQRADRGIACGAQGETRGVLRRVQAEAHAWRGAFPPSVTAGTEAMTLLPVGGGSWFRAAGMAIISSGNASDLPSLRATARALSEWGPRGETCAAQAMAWALTGWVLLLLGETREARRFFDWIDLLHRDLESGDDVTALGWATMGQFYGLIYGDDPERTVAVAREAVGHFEVACDQRNLAVARGQLGWALFGVGAHEAAELSLREALALATRTRSHYIVAMSQRHLGAVLGRRGRTDEARRFLTEAIAALESQGHRRMECEARIFLGRILLDDAELDAAEREVRAAAESALALPPIRAQALATLADIALVRGQAAEALAATEIAMKLLEALGTLGEPEGLILRSHAEALDASGDSARAGATWRLAADRLTARAAKIRDPSLRRSFLEDVPDHARIISAARDS